MWCPMHAKDPALKPEFRKASTFLVDGCDKHPLGFLKVSGLLRWLLPTYLGCCVLNQGSRELLWLSSLALPLALVAKKVTGLNATSRWSRSIFSGLTASNSLILGSSANLGTWVESDPEFKVC